MRAKTGKNCIYWQSSDWCALPGKKGPCNLPCEHYLSKSAVKRLGSLNLAEEEKKLRDSIYSLQQQLSELTGERGRVLAALTHEFKEFEDEVRTIFIWFWAQDKQNAEKLTRMAFTFRRTPRIVSIPCTNGETLEFAECVQVVEGELFLFSHGRFFSHRERKPAFVNSFSQYGSRAYDFLLLGENTPVTRGFVNQLRELAPIPARFIPSIKARWFYADDAQETFRSYLQSTISEAVRERFKDFKTPEELADEALNITLKQLLDEYEAMKGLGADG